MYKISYTGDGTNTEFVFSFPFFQNADIKVAIDDVLLDDTQLYDAKKSPLLTLLPSLGGGEQVKGLFDAVN